MADLPPAAIARFRRDLAALAGRAPGRLGLAVSGGPDSLSLLLLAHTAFPGDVRAATVDHGLRAESAGEAAFVATLCAGLGVPHSTLTATAPPSGNIQSSARELRYRLLADWAEAGGIALLLTGHHADDQAETLLMRLMRGSGLAGLAGIRGRNAIAGVELARPLLGWRRADLAELVVAAGIDAVADPSNADPRFDRVRLRQRLAEEEWLDPAALARSAAALGEAEAALEWATDRLVAERVEGISGGVTLDPDGLPAELRRRLLLRILQMLVPADPPRGEAVQRLLAALEGGDTATLAGVKCSGGPVWRFTAEGPRRAS
jgi:tRNA(Ile)-lysidine synthase